MSHWCSLFAWCGLTIIVLRLIVGGDIRGQLCTISSITLSVGTFESYLWFCKIQMRVIKFRSQSTTSKMAATKWVQNPLSRSDFSPVTAISPRKVADAQKTAHCERGIMRSYM